jgi:hypothetical protein
MSGLGFSSFYDLISVLAEFAYRINRALELACQVESLLSRRCDLYRHNFPIDVIALFLLPEQSFDLFPHKSHKLDAILHLFANRDCIRAEILKLS